MIIYTQLQTGDGDGNDDGDDGGSGNEAANKCRTDNIANELHSLIHHHISDCQYYCDSDNDNGETDNDDHDNVSSLSLDKQIKQNVNITINELSPYHTVVLEDTPVYARGVDQTITQ